MKSLLTSLLTLLAIVAAAALVVTFTGITPGLNDNVAKAQTSGAQPSASPSPAAGTATPSPTPTGNIIQTLSSSGQFTLALNAIQSAGLTQTLESGGPYTVFAPTDAAFAKVPPAQLATTLNNPNLLKQILNYHVVSGEYSTSQLRGMNQLTSLEGAPIRITTSGNTVMVNGANVVLPDLYATNGVIQGIDQVLQLPAAGATPGATATP